MGCAEAGLAARPDADGVAGTTIACATPTPPPILGSTRRLRQCWVRRQSILSGRVRPRGHPARKRSITQGWESEELSR